MSEIHGIRPAELVEARKNGQKVFGAFCVYVPDEVVIAANGIVTGLCGGSRFWEPDGEKVLPEDIDAIRECIARHNAPHHSIVPLPCQIRPGRGRFC